MTQESAALLKSYLDQKSIPQALLFVGSNMGEMVQSATDFVLEVFRQKGSTEENLDKIQTGNHPDFALINPSSKSAVYTIEQIRWISTQSQFFPHEAALQFFVLKYADRMQEAAANALLKTIEEPNSSTHFILLTPSLDQILPTVASRLQKVFFEEEEESSVEKKHEQLLETLLKKWPNFSYNDLHLTSSSILEELESTLSKKERTFDETLFFNHESDILFLQIEKWFTSLKNKAPFSLRKFEALLETSRIGFQRSIKLSTCIESLMLNFIL